jgi:hypothetical protein
MFGQDCDSVREFCSLNVVNHFVSETQKGRKFFVVVKGVLDPSTPQSGGQIPCTAPINLTVIYAMADNNGLFLGVPGTSPFLNQFACPWLPIGTLAAEVFVA